MLSPSSPCPKESQVGEERAQFDTLRALPALTAAGGQGQEPLTIPAEQKGPVLLRHPAGGTRGRGEQQTCPVTATADL